MNNQLLVNGVQHVMLPGSPQPAISHALTA